MTVVLRAVCELASRAALAADRVRLAAERAESWAAAAARPRR